MKCVCDNENKHKLKVKCVVTNSVWKIITPNLYVYGIFIDA